MARHTNQPREGSWLPMNHTQEDFFLDIDWSNEVFFSLKRMRRHPSGMRGTRLHCPSVSGSHFYVLSPSTCFRPGCPSGLFSVSRELYTCSVAIFTCSVQPPCFCSGCPSRPSVLHFHTFVPSPSFSFRVPPRDVSGLTWAITHGYMA